MNKTYIHLGWVKPQKMEELKGMTPDALKSKRTSGQFIEGVHWRKAGDGNIYYNFEAIDDWINGETGLKDAGRPARLHQVEPA